MFRISKFNSDQGLVLLNRTGAIVINNNHNPIFGSVRRSQLGEITWCTNSHFVAGVLSCHMWVWFEISCNFDSCTYFRPKLKVLNFFQFQIVIKMTNVPTKLNCNAPLHIVWGLPRHQVYVSVRERPFSPPLQKGRVPCQVPIHTCTNGAGPVNAPECMLTNSHGFPRPWFGAELSWQTLMSNAWVAQMRPARGRESDEWERDEFGRGFGLFTIAAIVRGLDTAIWVNCWESWFTLEYLFWRRKDNTGAVEQHFIISIC